MVSFHDIEAARRRCGDAIKVTPCRASEWLSRKIGGECFLKLENHQHTGSFKSRGAVNKLLQLTADERARGVVAASAGNHAQGVAYHATRLGIPSTIVMPAATPVVKVTRTQEYGATILLHGSNYAEALAKARELSAATGAVLIHGFDDDAIIAGQGTAGLELVEQDPFAEVAVIPVGGGGLIAGMALALKKARPTMRIVGVEAEAVTSMQQAIASGGPVSVQAGPTLAEGIAVGKVGQRCYEICRDLVDEYVSVSDDEVARAILFLLEREKTVAEGAGAAAVAALLYGKVRDVAGRNVVAVVSGGNIDVTLLSRIIERGLVESGRLARIEIMISDRPGGLAGMLSRVAEAKANVVELRHERAFFSGGVANVQVELKVETRGADHVAELVAVLEKASLKPRLL